MQSLKSENIKHSVLFSVSLCKVFHDDGNFDKNDKVAQNVLPNDALN